MRSRGRGRGRTRRGSQCLSPVPQCPLSQCPLCPSVPAQTAVKFCSSRESVSCPWGGGGEGKEKGTEERKRDVVEESSVSTLSFIPPPSPTPHSTMGNSPSREGLLLACEHDCRCYNHVGRHDPGSEGLPCCKKEISRLVPDRFVSDHLHTSLSSPRPLFPLAPFSPPFFSSSAPPPLLSLFPSSPRQMSSAKIVEAPDYIAVAQTLSTFLRPRLSIFLPPFPSTPLPPFPPSLFLPVSPLSLQPLPSLAVFPPTPSRSI